MKTHTLLFKGAFILSCLFLKPNSLVATLHSVSTEAQLITAINSANATVGDTIQFTNNISLTGPLPAITSTYTIDGDDGVTAYFLDGGSAVRGFMILGASANPTIQELHIRNVLAKGGDGGAPQEDRGGGGGGGLGAGGGIYVGNSANATISNVTFASSAAKGGDSSDSLVGNNSGGGGGGGLGGNGGTGSGAGGNGGGGGGGGFLSGNDGGNGIANVGGAGGANGGGMGASNGVAATSGSYGGGGGGACAANNSAGVAAIGGYGGGGGGSSRIGANATNDAANGGFGAGGGGGGRSGGVGGTSVFGGGTGGTGGGNNDGAPGGGGAAFGGAVFVDDSSTLTIITTVEPFAGSALTAGTGGIPVTVGMESGIDIFLASGGNLKINIPTGTVSPNNDITADTLASTGGLEKLGAGTLNLAGRTNTYRGTTVVTAGTLQFTDDTNLGSTSLLSLSGGNLEPNATFTSTKPVSIDAPSFITVPGAFSFTHNASISGSEGFAKLGTGTLILSGVNGYAGSTTLSAGITQVDIDSSLGTGPLILSGGTYETTSSFPSSRLISITGVSEIETTGVGTTLTQNGVISSTGGSLEKSGDGTLNLTAINNFTVPVAVSAGTLLLSGSGTLGSAGNLNLTGGGFEIAAGAGTKSVGALSGGGTGINLNDNTLEIGNGTFGGVISGSGGITKNTAGTLTLTAGNFFTGPSTINGGILELS